MSRRSGDFKLNGDLPPLPSDDSSHSSPDSPSWTRGRPRSSHRVKGKERTPTMGKDFARFLAYEEQENKELRQLLHNTSEQLRAERQRADDAERRAREIATRLKSINESHIVALQDAARANEELK